MFEMAIVAEALRDRRAFAPLYEAYLDPIYGFCYRRLGERAAAEDAAAQVFLKSMERLHQFKGGSFKAWLYAIAVNALRDLARADRSLPPPDDLADWQDPAASPEEQAIARADIDELRHALTHLPDEWRNVVELRLERLSCDEVARALGTGRTAEWVRQVHHRAVQRLGQLLAPEAIQNGGPR
jgi:RNA polymerase sigma factor (sigma-70 family)